MPSSSTTAAISPEQLIALNDEIAALVRAGVPLELGLTELGEDAAGALGRISSQLADRMKQGASLPEALAAEGGRFPAAYRAVIEAGLRAGRLPAALEAVSSFTAKMLDFRRKIGLAALYPLTIVGLAYGLFLLFLAEIVVRYQSAYETFRLPLPWLLRSLLSMRESMAVWAWIQPLLIAVAVWWMFFARRSAAAPSGIPFIGVRNFRYAMFAELLAMQLEHQVPLPEGIVLSADAAGSPAMRQAGRLLADHVSQGGQLAQQPAGTGALPPFLRWLMINGERQGNLSRSLRLAAEMYRRRGNNSLNWFKTLFPLAASIFIGGGIAILYALGLFVPFIQLLGGLSGGDMHLD